MDDNKTFSIFKLFLLGNLKLCLYVTKNSFSKFYVSSYVLFCYAKMFQNFINFTWAFCGFYSNAI